MKKQEYQKVTHYEARKGDVKKIVLLYSGSLYTSVMIKLLQQNYKADVIALLVDIGQKEDFEQLQQQAKSLGAKVVFQDAKEIFAKEYLTKAIKANGTYQEGYHLTSPLSRPLLVRLAVEVAAEEGAGAIAHGSSGVSNDQIRIESMILALNPDMRLIAPFRENILSRGDLLKLARQYKIPVPYTEPGYSYDENLWGVSIIGGDIETTQIPSRIEHFLRISTLPEKSPEVPERLTIDFVNGIPTKINGKSHGLVRIIEELTKIGGRHGIGLNYNIEDMILGIKNRSIEEEPAPVLLIAAHKKLEMYVSTREENEFKQVIDNKWAYLVYEGKWYEPLKKDLESYINTVNEKVTGIVHLRLYRGRVEIIGIKTPRTIFEKKLPTFTNRAVINRNAVAGYIELSSLSMQLANRGEKTILLTIGKRTNKFKLLSQLRKLNQSKYTLFATYKTHKFLVKQGIASILVNKIHQPHLKPNLKELLEQNRFDLIIRIPSGKDKQPKERSDGKFILEKAVQYNVPLITDIKEAQELLKQLESKDNTL